VRLVLASNNAGKLSELQALLEPLGVALVRQAELGIPETDEPHVTFFENALAKARHAARLSGSAALADDSGLCVEALGGAPGVRSARYALDLGDAGADASNNAALLRELGAVGATAAVDRSACFVCVLVAVRSADDPQPLVALGRWAGHILDAPRGVGGFGYDPLMFVPELGCAVAELSPAQKNALSHRALAASDLCRQLREAWRID
jgi:XTP/dITP diphosphohydrolase